MVRRCRSWTRRCSRVQGDEHHPARTGHHCQDTHLASTNRLWWRRQCISEASLITSSRNWCMIPGLKHVAAMARRRQVWDALGIPGSGPRSGFCSAASAQGLSQGYQKVLETPKVKPATRTRQHVHSRSLAVPTGSFVTSEQSVHSSGRS
ncbi:hypothetical protein BU25DRAFT_59954 [Macroventuria anomochaeta]|uniref:Uncharacterized protein n=1 Tax=Macroventuria anomochaeta TaxID=301207 RepID=A0ACB6S244_9PLEO|nr:uncharacterized protein BU25DRAFT_59954 [Macroventuria anomochaeta]KAF2627730.1 hypothetical protein BU25DRAFT_59954 [Macroventuria anomochaeta]